MRKAALAKIKGGKYRLQMQRHRVMHSRGDSSLLQGVLHGVAVINFYGVLRVRAGIALGDNGSLDRPSQQVVIGGGGLLTGGKFFIENLQLCEQDSCLNCVEAAVDADADV